MSLVVVAKVPTGVVLATDRRGTVRLVEGAVSPGESYYTVDGIAKLVTFPPPHQRVAVAYTAVDEDLRHYRTRDDASPSTTAPP